MDNIKRTNYLVNEKVCEVSTEQNIDSEINLPDYCPDIGNVLQCFALINLASGAVNEESIKAEGTVLLRVLYLSDGDIFSYEQSEPFSASLKNTCSATGVVLDLATYLQYVNCTPVGPRKIGIHGAFILKATVSASTQNSVIADIGEEHIQLNKDTISACSASGSATADVTLNQVVDIGNDKAPMRSIIRNTATPLVVETKQVSGKMLVKGELKIKTLYKSENKTVEYVENTLPLSQIMDVEGMNENSTADVKLKLLSLDVAMKPSALGNMSLLDIGARVQIGVSAYNCIDFPVLKNAYSTDYASTCSYKDVCVDRIVSTITKNYLHSFEMENISNVSRVIDIWCDQIRSRASMQDGQLVFSGKLDAYVLYEDMDENIALKSAQSDFAFAENIREVGQVKCEPHFVIQGCDYVIQENGIEIRADLQMSAVIFECMSTKVVDDITLGDEMLKKSTSLYIDYAHKGDEVWDIAEKYRTTVGAVMQENDLSVPTLEADKALLIWG